MTKPMRGTSELPAYLSHELRNALACIQQFGNILIDGLAGELSGEQREYLGIMLENASKIRSVLDSALDGTSEPTKEGTSKIARFSKLET
ncbi:MAG: histidine kinase dimerization/phospho-acceptor domain-containing protein [Candidatus Sulfotelmatobacter sp.]